MPEGWWGEKVDRRNVLEPQGVEFQQMSALVLEGRDGEKKPWEKKKPRQANPNTPHLKASQPRGISSGFLSRTRGPVLTFGENLILGWFGSVLSQKFIQKPMQ